MWVRRYELGSNDIRPLLHSSKTKEGPVSSRIPDTSLATSPILGIHATPCLSTGQVHKTLRRHLLKEKLAQSHVCLDGTMEVFSLNVNLLLDLLIQPRQPVGVLDVDVPGRCVGWRARLVQGAMS